MSPADRDKVGELYREIRELYRRQIRDLTIALWLWGALVVFGVALAILFLLGVPDVPR